MTGAEMQTGIIDTARLCGWTVAHFRPARTKHGWATPVAADGKGFPDLVLVHPERGIRFVEVKGSSDRVRPEQQMWIDRINEAGGVALVVTPPVYDAFLELLAKR